MATQDYVQRVVSEVAQALTPLVTALGSAEELTLLFGGLGWELDDGAAASLIGALRPAGTAVQAFASDATASADVATLTRDVAAVAAALIACAPATTGALPSPLDIDAFWQALPDDLLESLLFDHLDQHHQLAFGLLAALGVIYLEAREADPATGRAAFQRKSVSIDRLTSFIGNPAEALRTNFGWGGAFDHEAATWALGSLLRGLRANSVTTPATGQLLDQYFDVLNPARGAVDQLVVSAPALSAGDGTAVAKAALVVLAVPPSGANTAAPEGLVLRPTFLGQVSATFPVGDVGSMALSGTATDTPIEIYLRPSGVSAVVSVTGVQAQLTVLLSVSPTAPLVIAGDPAGCRLELRKAHLSFGVTAAQSGIVLTAEATFDQLRLVVDTGEGDAFVSQVVGAGPLQVDVGPGVTWSSATGLRFADQDVLTLDIPLHVSVLGVLGLDLLSLRPRSGSDGSVVIDIGVRGSLSFGPFTVSLQGIGLSTQVRGTDAAHPGNIGPADLAFGFKPPDGLGLALQAPPVTGVGFIAFDEADARYLGAIALQVGDVAISAVGVLDTKVPGGGYSLIVVASAQFPPIQLGFGFSLSAIGGLVGVNRTADVPTLQALARAGRLDDLMFPADLIHRAPQVAANLAQQFPVAQGHFIVGPAVQIQWGTGGLVYADIGVFIELTDSGGGVTVLRIALLGLVHLTLPDGAAPVADITLDVLGVLDFAAKTLSLDAGLRNSTIATFPLTGQAALRTGWGASPEFLFAVGGFNPCFQAPTGFPALQRVALSIGGDNPRLRLSAYLALTSNTLQLGCAADLYASVQAAGVTAAVAASLTFDALVQFKPFGLRVDLTISAAILINGNPILAMSLDLHVIGPNPWTVTGSASFQFLFATITIPVSIPGGTPAAPQPATPVDLDGNLLTALADPRSWATGPPTGRSLVRVRSQGTASTAVHPLGSLTVRQRAVPLGQRIECYGPDPLKAPCQYDITGTDLGTQPVAGTAVSDYFAPAQFRLMNDQDKLSSPSFESMTAGATLGSADLSLAPIPVPRQPPPPVVDSVSAKDWDYLTLDSPDPAPPAAAPAAPAGTAPPAAAASGSTSVPDQLLAAQLGGAAAARSGPAGQPEVIYASPGIGIGVQDPYYAITGLDLGVPASTDLPSLTAGLTAAAQAGYQRDWQIVCTSEVG